MTDTKTNPRQLEQDMQLDIENAFMGKLWCYTPVTDNNGAGLGVAVANELGYSPVPLGRYLVAEYEDAQKEADRLNALREITERAASDIIITTMRQGTAHE